jgi:hypothetical protein
MLTWASLEKAIRFGYPFNRMWLLATPTYFTPLFMLPRTALTRYDEEGVAMYDDDGMEPQQDMVQEQEHPNADFGSGKNENDEKMVAQGITRVFLHKRIMYRNWARSILRLSPAVLTSLSS